MFSGAAAAASNLRRVEARRIAVIGSGAIGGVLAAAAHDLGHQVTLCARTPFDRLSLETPDGTAEVPVPVVTEPDAVGDVDWVLLTTKVPDVAGARPWLERLDAPGTPVVVVQNGIEHRESVADMGLSAPVLPALIYVAAERVRPGHVVRRSPGTMLVEPGEVGTRFAALLAGSPVEVSVAEDFAAAAWRKLLSNVGANPITALTLRRLDVFDVPEVRDLGAALLDEALAVARAEGAALTRADVDAVVSGFTSDFPRENGSSMLYDRLAGLPTEHEHITGAVVRAARRHGIPVPRNETVLALMRGLRPTRLPASVAELRPSCASNPPKP